MKTCCPFNKMICRGFEEVRLSGNEQRHRGAGFESKTRETAKTCQKRLERCKQLAAP